MRFSIAASVVFAAATVSANSYSNGTDYTTTEVVTSYTTFCPGPTEVVEGGKTYTVTEATTLTITDCPCTLTKTYASVPAATATSSDSDSASPETDSPTYPAGTAPGAAGSTGGSSSGGYGNSTGPAATGGAGSSSAPSSPASPSGTGAPFEGSAGRATVAGGALAGVLGLVAALL